MSKISSSSETLSSNDVIQCLYSDKASDRCRIGISDAVLFQSGVPASWYYTGRSGEILKKKHVDLKLVSDRWLRINQQNESMTICVMRQSGGVVKFLGREAWKALVDSSFATASQEADGSIVSLHCYVKGNAQTIFRNFYTFNPGTGRISTRTVSYDYCIEDADEDTVTVIRDRDCTMTESRALAVNNIMDLATSTLVRYMELMLNARVLEVAIDYVVDSKSQLWMMWSSESKIARMQPSEHLPSLQPNSSLKIVTEPTNSLRPKTPAPDDPRVSSPDAQGKRGNHSQLPSVQSSKGILDAAAGTGKARDRLNPSPIKTRSTKGGSDEGYMGEKTRTATWKYSKDAKPIESIIPEYSPVQFKDLDEYLREGSKALSDRKIKMTHSLAKKRLAASGTGHTEGRDDLTKYCAKILVACSPGEMTNEIMMQLVDNFFEVDLAQDGRQAINNVELREGYYDCILVQRDLILADAFDVARGIRNHEKELRNKKAAVAAKAGSGVPPTTKRIVIICVTDKTTPADIKSYMAADMDGCLSIPVDRRSLITTVRAAVPRHLAVIEAGEAAEATKTPKVYHLGALNLVEGGDDSNTKAIIGTKVGHANTDDNSVHGFVQIDADTKVPYEVLDFSRDSAIQFVPKKSSVVFNLVICHDLFDTYEKMRIFFKPIAKKYIGLQILLWNYPGQAFTEWRPDQLLNNEYLARCLNDVIGQVGSNGTKDFDSTKPFFVLGFGNGASISSFYASHYSVPNLKGLININGWSYIDSYIAGVMHDCINIFQCAPPTRPDLPVYFYSRFLFSKDYLVKVSVPLALNLYTAVHNPISLKGRIMLCKGVLKSIDLRPILREIDCPVICLQSTQDTFVRPLHTEPFVTHRGGEAKTIYRALRERDKTCVVWFKSGHEVFQECKKSLQTLMEQLLIGFHESHDIAFPAAPIVDRTGMDQSEIVSADSATFKMHSQTVEDKFIENILGTVNKLQHNERSLSPTNQTIRFRTTDGKEDSVPLSSIGYDQKSIRTNALVVPDNPPVTIFSASDPQVWNKFASTVAEQRSRTAAAEIHQQRRSKRDPTQSNNKAVKSLDPNAAEFPEVKEYMSWRIKRNKKRLNRLQQAARIIQGAFRSHLARKLIKGIRRRKAACVIQRNFRGYLGRKQFISQARKVWASLLVQRVFRGYMGRMKAYKMRLRIAAACNIQRIFRGFRARIRVRSVLIIRHDAVCRIQALFRRVHARRETWRRRLQKFAATVIQRYFRGNLGRRRANAERDKYIFSKSQSQGIEFGRQMLLEHKLHATRLQSDVTLLTQEKIEFEEKVEALLEEITSFEEGVRVLEKEMHQLSKVEADSLAFMDEDSKSELREHKLRLDREFGEMLTMISSRKEILLELERKLANVDKARQSKEEELRTLERKLVVLLEEQQNELKAIKRKQDVRGALLAASHEEIMNATASGGKLAIEGGGASVSSGGAGGTSNAIVLSNGGGTGYGGPGAKEKRQAAQLMQSTETLMKFGFMSMSMTYFSSLNMIKALRTVSAQDTVMAALADLQSQRVLGGGSGGQSSDQSLSSGKGGFVPGLKAGQLPGQEGLSVSSWSVEDVARWLQSLALGQYSEAFIDAAVDGEFLYDLNDDDLKNTLGVEHKLHRKKILSCIDRLKEAELQRESRIAGLVTGTKGGVAGAAGDLGGSASAALLDGELAKGPKVSFQDLVSLTRHSKFVELKEALDYLPDKLFDKTLVKVPFMDESGTVYTDGYESLPFHINKTDEYGNTLLILAAQNGHAKVAKYLIQKGANPNHQNYTGNTAGHFANAFQFFDLSQWLFANGADDTITNKFDLTPYDGLEP